MSSDMLAYLLGALTIIVSVLLRRRGERNAQGALVGISTPGYGRGVDRSDRVVTSIQAAYPNWVRTFPSERNEVTSVW